MRAGMMMPWEWERAAMQDKKGRTDLPLDLGEDLDVLDDRLVGGEEDVELDDGVLPEVACVGPRDVGLVVVEVVVPDHLPRLAVFRWVDGVEGLETQTGRVCVRVCVDWEGSGRY